MTVVRPSGSLTVVTHALRLVQRDVEQVFRGVKQLAVHLDVVASRSALVPSSRDHRAVDRDAAFLDDLLGLAAGGDAGARQDLL